MDTSSGSSSTREGLAPPPATVYTDRHLPDVRLGSAPPERQPDGRRTKRVSRPRATEPRRGRPGAVTGEPGPDPVVRLVRRYATAEWYLFVLGVVAGVLGRGASLVPPLVVGVAIDSLFGRGDVPYRLPLVPAGWIPADQTGQLALSAGLVVAALVASVGFGWVGGVSLSLFSNRVQHAVRVDAYAAVQRLDMAFFDDEQTGQVLAVLGEDVRNLRNFLGSSVASTLQLAATVVGIAAVLVWLNAQLALVTLVAVPLLGGFTLWFMGRARPLYRALRASVGSLTSQLENNVSGIEVIKTSNAEAHEESRVAAASEDYYHRAMAVANLEYLYQPTMDLLAGLAFAATFLLGGYWLLFGAPGPFTGSLLVGEFVTFLFMTQRFVDPLSGVGRIVNSYENARSSAERVFGLTDRPTGVDEPDDPVRLESVAGRVEFDDVSFSYGDDRPVLHGVSFAAEPGETVALVGPTGAGKSTAAKLLARLYDVTGGRVTVDGHDVRTLRLADLRGAIGYVSQDVFLFDGTVRENLTYGAFDATHAEMEAAARAAEAHEFVARLPEGYDTRIGERGVKLSGGQRQRLAIARAMLQDPDVLVLDEATSAVDTETELLVQRGIARLAADRTTLVVAHRLSTVRHADTIVVLEGGRVVESGTHDELIAADGLYAALWSVQAGDLDSLPKSFVRTAARRLAHVESSDATGRTNGDTDR
jgi:ATP-binding cassette subfamily B protein